MALASAYAMPCHADNEVPTDSVPAGHVVPTDSVPAGDEVYLDAEMLAAPEPASAPAVPKPKINPTDIDREKPQGPILHFYDKHGEPLETPVRFLTELDTVQQAKPRAVYPAYNGLEIGVNVFDGLMMAFGQKRANFDASVAVSLFNWIFPVVEGGVGFANAKPQDGRCHYEMKPAPYIKLGVNYNLLYKSSPDYKAYLGFRAGWGHGKYSISDIKPGSDYYTDGGTTSYPDMAATVWFGELMAGLQVKIYRGFSMGWAIKMHFNFKTILPVTGYNTDAEGNSVPVYGPQPWFMPGYGTNSGISANFSLVYRFGSRPSVHRDEGR